MARIIRLLLPLNDASEQATRPYFDWEVSPPSPTNIEVVSSGQEDTIETASAILKWDIVVEATSYNIYRAGEVIANIAVPQYEFLGLLPNVVEHLGISAVNDDGESVISCFDLYIETGNYEGDVDFPSPTNLRVTEDAGEYYLNWDEPSLPSVSYNVFQQVGSAFNRINNVVSPNSRSLLGGLKSNTTYVFGVTAIYEIGESAMVTLTYTTGILGEQTITNFRWIPPIDYLTSRVTLAWDALSGAKQYELQYESLYGLAYEPLDANVTQKSLIVSLGRDYSFVLTAEQADGHWTEPVVCDVRVELARVQNFRVDEQDASKLKLAWNNYVGRESTVTYRLVDTLSGQVWNNITTTDHVLENLSAGWRYHFQLFAQCDGFESYEPVELVVSDQFVAESVEPTVTQIYENELLVSWNSIGADRYEISINDGERIIDAGTGLHWNIDNLSSSTRYKISVRGNFGDVQGDYGVTYGCTMPLLWFENLTPSSFDVVWLQYAPQAGMYYHLRVGGAWDVDVSRVPDGANMRVRSVDVDGFFCSSLDRYSVELWASEDVAGQKIIPVSYDNQEIAGAVGGLSEPLPQYWLSPETKSVTSNSITISFLLLPAEEDFRKYELFIGENKIDVTRIDATGEYTHSGLSPATSYNVGIRYVKADGRTSELETITVITAA